MVAPVLACAGDPKILDIRRDIGYHGVPEIIIDGLTSEPPSLPEFLLWDNKGLELFDCFSQTSSYYPFHSEIEILVRYASEIASTVPIGGAVIELGCGTIRKTKTFLSVFDREQRPIQYFALDLSRQGLTESIIKLSEALHESEFLTVTGLLGTYEDCILWLNQPENLNGLSSITFLWMGNSIANFPHHSDASAFLGRFREACQLSRINCSFILSTDICDRSSRMNEAYNLDKPELQAWLSNGLKHANTALGGKVFRFEDWKIITEFDPQEHNLNTYYTALFDIKLNLKSVKGKPIVFSKGTRIPIITSGKWSEEIMGEICVDAGFRIQQRWKDDSRVYCVYHLASIGG